jgi:hypothetical protein
MPGYDNTGPMGQGKLTGRGFGPCSYGLGWWRRFGPKKDLNRRLNWHWPQYPSNQADDLTEYQSFLETELAEVKTKLEELKKE